VADRLKILFKQIFSISNIDNHKVIYILGLRIRKKMPPVRRKITLDGYGLNTTPRKVKITLSLTTFPQRINTVSHTIKTLLSQSLKPDRVVLWLAKEQFPNAEDELPQDLLDLKNFGLTIMWCNDLRSYKKLLPSLKNFGEDIIITFDDDIYYPEDTVENLYNSYLKNPSCIHTNRARRLYIRNNRIHAENPAVMYWTRYNDCTFKNTLTGCGGVLYPPHVLHDNVFNEREIKELLPTQDDIWFWTMAVLNNTKIKVVSSFDIQLPTVEKTQQYGLSKINSVKGSGMGSLDALNLIAEKYPQILEKLQET